MQFAHSALRRLFNGSGSVVKGWNRNPIPICTLSPSECLQVQGSNRSIGVLEGQCPPSSRRNSKLLCLRTPRSDNHHGRLARHEWPSSSSFSHQKFCKPRSLDESNSDFSSNPPCDCESTSRPFARRETASNCLASNKLAWRGQVRMALVLKTYLSLSSFNYLSSRM